MSSVTSNLYKMDDDSSQLAAFKPNHYDDPFLSHPPNNDEQLIPIWDAHHLCADSTPDTHNTQQHLLHHPPVANPTKGLSPYDAYSRSGNPSGRSSPSFLSPESNAENGQSDLSNYSSPALENQLFGDDQSHLTMNSSEWEQLYLVSGVLDDAPPPPGKHGQHGDPGGQANRYSRENHLLSPVLTNTPSPTIFSQQPSGDLPANHDSHDATISPTSIISERQIEVPALRLPARATTPSSNPSETDSQSYPDHPPSPRVKISSYSRGDTPSRGDDTLSRQSKRRSTSSTYLAPEDSASDEAKDEENNGVDDRRGGTGASSSSPTLRAADGSWIRNPSTGLGGLDPSSRTKEHVPNLREITAQRELEEKNAVVQHWLFVSDASSEIEDNNLSGFRPQKKWRFTRRRRARSTGDSPAALRGGTSKHEFDDSTIPGPGVLIDEESETDDDDDSHTSDSSPPRSPSAIDSNGPRDSEDGYFPPMDNASISNEEPLPRQFIRARPWKDSPRNQRFGDMREQPFTSNAAIFRFLRRADNIETASRRATWGTLDVTEADVESILGNNSRFNSMRISDDSVREKFFKRSNILGHASKFLPKRSHSGAKRKHSLSTEQIQPSAESLETLKSSSGSSGLPQRKPSFTRRSKTPSNTGSALLEIGRQIASVGVGGPVELQPAKPTGPWNSLMKRSRSRSDVLKGLGSPNSGKFIPLMTASGGPPAPTVSSPSDEKSFASNVPAEQAPVKCDENDHDNDEDEEEVTDDKGIVMDFPVRVDLIVPTLEGFKTHVQQLNPRLEPALVERVGQEQLRRYKKLVELRLKHSQAVNRHGCTSGKHCFGQGGNATILPPRASPKDADSTFAPVQSATAGAANDDTNGAGDGAVTAALFPPGVPLPPVKRLPAEFECSLCFKVKKFQKPSDWTKHVHEDIQPFTCTFPECPEPKSFKRKADWVRHESERHRHLEWWACSLPDCTHVCHRKDNFVQHLVREHKMPEPKVKGGKGRVAKISKATLNAADDNSYGPDVEKVWDLVEKCRHVTTKQATEEACRFCGNVCNSWKKLTVHMAKHMEQIAMPVLNLVEQRTISPSTILSPVDDPGLSSTLTTPVDAYPGPIGGPRRLSSHSQRGRGKGRNGQPIVCGTAALLTEAFSIQQPPASAQQLQMYDALPTVPSNGPQPYSMPASPYALQPSFSQGNSPSLPGQSYRGAPQVQRHYGTGNMATYPPPFNAPPRPPGALEATDISELPYNMEVPGSAMGIGGGPIYASPIEHLPYGDALRPGGMEQGTLVEPKLYNTGAGGGTGYPMEPSGPAQGFAYAHAAGGPHPY
ncbi:hypothetical protein PRK78_003951 [Emydomyces testavorans]|uniref:C2H2-type domain-containing protein n=1 Tax=Emydomyces testavorans TaxID=2070801 RepID=A0AAF0IIU1_9EURO|nr:hypothetical protein PRK78_003951 [Emydomyces testavorans]